MKLRKLHIEDYKMFKDFDISFVDENHEALPIIILAGVNGSGKTTLLEFIYDYTKNIESLELFSSDNHQKIKIIDNENDYISVKSLDKNLGSEMLINGGSVYTRKITYFPSGTDDISKVEEQFVKYWYNQVKFYNKRNNEITEELQKFISKILDGLDFDFTYSYIDEDDNIFFQNSSDEKFEISELSTGEQTLLSKVLYLFLKDYKNKVILIDEPELSLHPSWQNKVLKIYENFAKENNCQIIIATHSPHIIGSAKNEYLRILRKEDDRIVAIDNIDKSYGLEFSQVLTNIMGIDYLRTPDVAKKMDSIKVMIVNNEYDSDVFKTQWNELEQMLGKDYLDLKLLKLEIASRKKRVKNR